MRSSAPLSARARRATAFFAGTAIPVAAMLLASATVMPTAASAGETIAYSYDARGRLVKVSHSGSINAGVTACYAYDKADNRSNVTVATTSDCSGSAPPVTFSISSNGAVTEGANSIFTITKSGTATTSLSVNYATADGTAIAPGDYGAASSSLAFATTETSKTVSVSTVDESVVESPETFTMSLSAPSGGATIGTGGATATINDNDSAATCNGVSFAVSSNAAVTEGTNSVYTVTKTGSTSSSCSVSYATANGTAAAPGDFAATSGALSFTSAQTSQTISVATIDDSIVESAETFAMNLSNATGGATISTVAATATINDNDSATGVCAGVSFAVSNASVVEGVPLVFSVSKSGSTTSSCSVGYATANGTATTPTHYTAASGTLTFTSTQTSKPVSVPTVDHSRLSATLKMYLNLSSPSAGSSISDSQGVGSIAASGGGCTTCLQSDGNTPADEGTSESPPPEPESSDSSADVVEPLPPPPPE